MARYFRLWRQFLITAFVREAEFRLNFFAGVAEGLAQLALAVLTFAFLFRWTDTIAGWTQSETLILVGIYRVVEGIIALQLAPNLWAISGAIRSGEMDFLLLRPASSQFLASLRNFALPEVINILIGVGVTIYAGNLAGIHWSPWTVAAAILFGTTGLVLLYALWFAIVTCSFWLVQVSTIDSLFMSLFQAARYPVSFFNSLMRALLTFVVPVAFATTFPAEALLGRADGRLLLAGTVFAGLALWATNRFWNYALRHYGSASS